MDLQSCVPLPPRPCSSISGGSQNVGDTRLINYTPEYAYETYLKTGSKHLCTHLSRAFFSKENILFITSQISAVLKHMTGDDVQIPFNDELVQAMVDVISENVAYTYRPGGVAVLNRMVVEREAIIHYNSLIRHKLFVKYYITQDRARVMPRAELTKQTRGETTISTSGHMLSSPWARYRNAYLKYNEGIETCEDGTHYNIPGYLQPKDVPIGPRRANEPAYQMGMELPSPVDCYKRSLHSQVYPDSK